MILRLLARGRTGRRTAIPARTVETPRRSSVNLFKGHTTSGSDYGCGPTSPRASRPSPRPAAARRERHDAVRRRTGLSPGRGPQGGGAEASSRVRNRQHRHPAASWMHNCAGLGGVDGAEAPVAVGGGIPRERVRPRRSLVRRPQQPAAGSATPHPNSASESTNRTKSACREMDCFW